MAYCIYIQNEKLNGCGQCRQLTEGVTNLEVDGCLYNAYAENPDMYIWNGYEVVIDPEYEAKQAQKEKERIGNLKLTKREVFLALYNDSRVTPNDIKSVITDPATLIEFEYATEYYRGNPLIDAIGSSLGYSKEELDYLFENKCFPLKVEDSTKEADTNA